MTKTPLSDISVTDRIQRLELCRTHYAKLMTNDTIPRELRANAAKMLLKVVKSLNQLRQRQDLYG